MNALERLQHWYASQCNGVWEHSFGVKLDTLDNPGWIVTVDLQDTELHRRPFVPVSRGSSETDADWLLCKVEQARFVGAGGVRNLEELLHTFLAWAQA